MRIRDRVVARRRPILRNSLVVVSLLALTACASSSSSDDEAYTDRRVTTGSNIPRKGNADTYDRDQAADSLSRSRPMIRPGGGN